MLGISNTESGHPLFLALGVRSCCLTCFNYQLAHILPHLCHCWNQASWDRVTLYVP